VYPKPFLDRTEVSVVNLLETVELKRAAIPGGVGLGDR
jgi:hypothetical protein